MSSGDPTLNSPASIPRRRILTLDGGGIRGVFALEILGQMEALLRAHTGKPNLVLADHFHFIGGTSTGAIIATFLAWGESVARVKQLYADRAREMFQPSPLRELAKGRYRPDGLSAFLRGFFVEEDPPPDRTATLGSSKLLPRILMVVLRNASKGSAWPLTNNPASMFNLSPLLPDGTPNPECNLNLPLWQLVRGSTAAPFFFPPESIRVGKGKTFDFVDGGLTPHNNPAVMAYLQATQPCYGLSWPTGVDKLLLVSVGTGRTRSAINSRSRSRMPLLLRHIKSVAPALIEGIGLHQDMMCRVMGCCIHGGDIDIEVRDLLQSLSDTVESGSRKFTYVRYDTLFSSAKVHQAEKSTRSRFGMDNLRMMPFLQEEGKAYAEEHVAVGHLL